MCGVDKFVMLLEILRPQLYSANVFSVAAVFFQYKDFNSKSDASGVQLYGDLHRPIRRQYRFFKGWGPVVPVNVPEVAKKRVSVGFAVAMANKGY